ncbi:MAG: hypothetical protein IKZ86_03985, partial [Spirochaetaceae bacterium]|nr:hypothetical protein [Spirochaetaceae bacterium]
GGGGGGGGGGGSTTTGGSSGGGTTAAASGSYSGSFTVGGGSYNTLAMSNGSFNIAGNTGDDLTGSYAADTSSANAIPDGKYILTCSLGTFTVTINGNNITLSKGTGTLNASGSGSSFPAAGWWKGTGRSPNNSNRPFVQFVHVCPSHVRYIFFDNGNLTDNYYVPITLSGNTISYDLHNASPVPAIPYSASFNFAVNGTTLTVSNLNIVENPTDHRFDNGQTTMNYTRIYTR